MKYPITLIMLLGVSICLLAGCQPANYRREADKSAYGIIGRAQKKVLGRTEPFTVETPADTLRRKLLLGQNLPHASPVSVGADHLTPVRHWPEKNYPPRQVDSPNKAPWLNERPLKISLADALRIAARNNREYQSQKEDVFRTALALDLEANEFRNLLFADAESESSIDYTGEKPVKGLTNTGSASWERRLKNGTLLTAQFAVDLVKLLTTDHSSSLGLFADATITIPLLRGSGRHVVTEPLTQAEREVVYSLQTFARFKRTLAVSIASEYLSVLQQLDQVRNDEAHYRRLIASTRRTRALADAGRLPEMQVGQALQNELSARDRWITAQQTYARRLDSFKISLGLPTDANIDLDRDELDRLGKTVSTDRGVSATTRPAGADSGQVTSLPSDESLKLARPTLEGGGPLEMKAENAVSIALGNRLDLYTALGRVYDAQRQVVVSADALKAGLTLTGSGQAGSSRTLGSAGLPNAHLRPEKGVYTAGILLDLPLERTAERNAYRNSFIALEQAIRDVQELEDQIKLQVRNALRNLLREREGYVIQNQAVALARRRVESTELFLQAGRAEIRDLLEAQESLVSAENALTAAIVSYRVAELELQRDMGVLEVDEKGKWREYEPKKSGKK
ncbi:MAG: TolC family protein [Planctomycetota bacterium]|nr:TolC family protein [Planctomycetota bacterium]